MFTNNRNESGNCCSSRRTWIYFITRHLNVYSIYTYGMEYYGVFSIRIVNFYDL